MTTLPNDTELSISGMTCGHCVKAVEGALKAIPGVQSVTVDLAGGRATVQGDADRQAMIAAIVDEGYTAQVAGA